jgi:predicted benzoate:H+ symporter BenE
MKAICLFAMFAAAITLAWPVQAPRSDAFNAPGVILLVGDAPQGQGVAPGTVVSAVVLTAVTCVVTVH